MVQLFQACVDWPAMSGKVYGWRTDTRIHVVTIFNASYELPLAEVQREVEKYGKVTNIKLAEFDCLDGTVTVCVEVAFQGW